MADSPSHPYIEKNLYIFKSTFQKPSQIYKFLRERWKESPFYLHRNLSYVNKHRQQIIVARCKKIDVISRRLWPKNRAKINSHEPGFEECLKINHVKNSHNYNHNNIVYNSIDYNLDINDVDPRVNGASVTKLSVNEMLYPMTRETKKRCYFDWICNDTVRQKTRSYGFICPWCNKDFHHLDSLMMHLRCSHSRFNFNLVEDDDETVINLTLNSSFDGSYHGFKYPGHDLKKDFRFSAKEPVRRVSETKIFFFRARKRSFNDNAITVSKNNNQCTIPTNTNNTSNSNNIQSINYNLNIANNYSYTCNHNTRKDNDYYNDGEADADCAGRLYYHTTTCLPIKPSELDLDSEADMDPAWLRERTQLMIDEFSDVNEGEKEILKMWNLHLMQNYQYKGDNMMRKACLEFVEKEGSQILTKRLFKNFTLHLANLFEFGLLSSGDVLECVRKLRKQQQNHQSNNINSGSIKSCKLKQERNSNEHCQLLSPAKRALLNSNRN